MSRAAAALLSIALAVGAGACGSKKPNLSRVLDFQTSQKQVANRGRTFYIVVRAVEEAQFLSETYDDVAKLVTQNATDESILEMELFWPGQPAQFVVEAPADKAIAVYCLFTRPSGDWKVLLSPPLDRAYRFVIGNRDIRIDTTPIDDDDD